MAITAFEHAVALRAPQGRRGAAQCVQRRVRVRMGPEGVYNDGMFVDEEARRFWEEGGWSDATAPLTEGEKRVLKERLPGPVAGFLIRRAEGGGERQGALWERVAKDLPPDVVVVEDEEYEGYVYDSVGGVPAFRRQGSSLFGGGDGVREETERGQSLFLGNVGSVDEQASQVGYSALALIVAWIVLKLLFTFIQFFVSFTFSFFAIFALSAGIFVVFFFFRF